MKSNYPLYSIFLLLTYLSGLHAQLPPHAQFLPENMIGMVTVHPGKILEKADHQSLINKPMVASLYSSNSFHDWMYDIVNSEDPEEEKYHGLFTRMIEKPAETTGIDLSQPVYIVFHTMEKLEVQIFARLSDPKQFEGFTKGIHRKKRKWFKTEGGRRGFQPDKHSLLVHDGKNMILTGRFQHPKGDLKKQADTWFQPKPKAVIKDFLKQQLDTSPDLGIYLALEPFVPFFSPRLPEGQKPPEHLADTKLFLALNSKPGAMEANLQVDAGSKHNLNFQGPELTKDIFQYMQSDAIAHATASFNLDVAYEHLLSLLPFFGMDADDLQDEILDNLKIDTSEVPDLFTGQLGVSITGLDLEAEAIEFIAAIGTKIPAAEVYVKIVQKGLFEALKGEGRRRNPLDNFSITAKDNLLLISSRNHSSVLEQGKVEKVISHKQKLDLTGGMFSLVFSVSELMKRLESQNEEIQQDEEYQFVTNLVLPHFKELQIQTSQSKPSRYGTTYSVRFQNEKQSGLKTLTHLIADLANPHFRNPEKRPKLLAAEARVKKEPDAFKKSIVGTWNGNFVEVEDQTYYKITISEDGTQKYEELYISKEGYSKFSDTGTWVVNGTTYKEYDAKGGLGYVTTILEANDSSITYVDYYDMYDEEIEPIVENRVSPNFQLPKIPKGLKELEDEDDTEEVEIEKKPEPENQKLPEPSNELKEAKNHGSYSFERVTANLAGKQRTRFIIVDFDVFGEEKDFKKLMKVHSDKIKRSSTEYLSSLSLQRMSNNTENLHNIMVNELKSKLNSLPEIDGKIKDLYFTAFNIQ